MTPSAAQTLISVSELATSAGVSMIFTKDKAIAFDGKCPIMLDAIRRSSKKGKAKIIGVKNPNKVYELPNEVGLAQLAFEVRERSTQPACGKLSIVNNTDK